MARILLLEADKQLSKNIKSFLNQAGHDVAVYKDPQTAISDADKKFPDVVILDLMLAGRSGIEFLYELRSYPDWQKVPLIITGRLSADEIQAFSDAFAQLGVAVYLPKQTTPLASLLAETETLLQPASV